MRGIDVLVDFSEIKLLILTPPAQGSSTTATLPQDLGFSVERSWNGQKCNSL